MVNSSASVVTPSVFQPAGSVMIMMTVWMEVTKGTVGFNILISLDTALEQHYIAAAW